MADEYFKPAIIKQLRTYMIVPGTKIPISKVIETLADPNTSYDELLRKHPALNKISQDEIFSYLAKALHIVEGFLKEQKDKYIQDQMQQMGLPEDKSEPKKKTADSKPAAPKAPKISLDIEGDINQAEEVKIFIDGGSLNNPGPAACGVVFKDLSNKILYTHKEFIGEATNNIAEYRGLIAALSLALNLKKDKVFIFSDSELLVKQMNGEYKIKNADLAKLAARAQELRRKFKKAQIIKVPREENQHADRLVRIAYEENVKEKK